MNRCNLAHKPMSIPQAMNIVDAKAKEWDKIQNLPAWRESKVNSELEVVEQAQQEGKTVYMASLMNIYHQR